MPNGYKIYQKVLNSIANSQRIYQHLPFQYLLKQSWILICTNTIWQPCFGGRPFALELDLVPDLVYFATSISRELFSRFSLITYFFVAIYADSMWTHYNMRQPEVAFCFMSGATPRMSGWVAPTTHSSHQHRY
jgi:hypothetical protein